MDNAERIRAYEQAGLGFVPAPCPQCGARNEDEANGLCKQTQDQTGEYNCAGDFNEQGISVQPTPESIAAMDAWIDEQVAAMEAEDAKSHS